MGIITARNYYLLSDSGCNRPSGTTYVKSAHWEHSCTLVPLVISTRSLHAQGFFEAVCK